MKKLLALTILGALTLAAAPVFAADAPSKAAATGAPPAAAAAPAPAATMAAPAAAPNSQQERMKACNTKAEGMKGDERKTFMSACLSGKEVPAKMTQQEKMKVCNVKAEGKKGDERKAFMSDCLKAA